MSLLRKLFGLGPKVNYHDLIANGAILIDVRTPSEFSQGNVKGSKNLPLNTIESKVENIKKIGKPIVLCCQSGMRSGQASSILKRNGVPNVYNGGSWHKFS